MKNLHKIVTISLLLVLMLCLTSFIGAGSVSMAAESVDFTTSDVMSDLSDMTINGAAFKTADYPAKATGDIEVLSLIEYGFTEKAAYRSSYALYVYVFNSAKINIVAGSGQNKVQLATKYNAAGNPADYEKFDIQLVSASDNGLFLKYKVIDHITADGSTFATRVNVDARRYDVSGIEILTRGSVLATDYTVGKNFVFTGYGKGLATESADTANLRCSEDLIETVELEVKHTNFLTAYSGYDFYGTERNIQSVYFALDNDKIEKYGYLYSIKMAWNYYEASVTLVIDDTDLYYKLQRFSGATIPASVDVNDYSAFKTALENAGYSDVPGTINRRFWFYMGISSLTEYNGHRVVAPIIFYTGGKSASTYIVKSEDFLDYLANYDKTYVGGRITIAGVEYSKDVFFQANDESCGYVEKIIELGDTFDVDVFDVSLDNAIFNKFFGVPNGAAVDNIKPIEVLTTEKLNAANSDLTLFINNRDMDDVKSYVSSATAADKTVYVIRYDVGINVSGNFPETVFSQAGGYATSNSVYLGFDVIWLTLFDEVTYTLIPAVSSPLNIASDITAPKYYPDTPDETVAWWIILIGVLSIIAAAALSVALFGLSLKVVQNIENKPLKALFGFLALVLSVGISTLLLFAVDALIIGGVRKWDFDFAAKYLWGLISK